MTPAPIQRRSPEVVLLLAIITCGLYLIYWYAAMYRELEQLKGEPLTSTGFWVDLLLVIVTCAIWGIWVDYRMATVISELEERSGLTVNKDTPTLIVILDLAVHVTFGLTFALTSAIMQDRLNKLMSRTGNMGAEPVVVTPPPSAAV